MKKIILALFLAAPCLASGPKQIGSNADPAVYREFVDVYQEIANPNINVGTASTMTITQLTVSTVAAITVNTTILTASTGTINSFMVVGTATNDDAPDGRFGQYISSANVAARNAPTTNTFGDFLAVTVPAGDWDMTIIGTWAFTDSTNTQFRIGISSVTGNTGITLGSEVGNFAVGRETVVNADNITQTVPCFRVKADVSKTYYFKYVAVYPATAPTLNGIMHARRVR